MDKLKTLVQELTELAQQQRWQEFLDQDESVRETIRQSVATASDSDKAQLAECLRKIQKIYKQAAAYYEGSQGDSATEIKSIQRGLRAAKSYLDNTRF